MARNRFFEDEAFEKPFNMQQFKRLMAYTRPYKKSFAVALTLMIIHSILSLSGPYITKLAVDEYIPQKDTSGLIILMGIFILIIALQIITYTFRVLLMTRTGHSIIYDLRKAVFANLQKLSFSYFDNRPAGKILVRVTNYVNSLAGLLSDGIINTIVDIVTLLAIIVIMLLINVKLTLISIATFIPLSIAISILQRKLKRKWQILNNKNSNRTAFIQENISGIKVIQAFTREKENISIFRGLNENVRTSYISAILTNNLFWPFVDGISVIGLSFTYIVGVQLITNQEITPGVLVALTGYLGRFWGPINNMAAIYSQLLTAMANTERIFETLDEEPEIKDKLNAIELPSIQGKVEFKDVTFGYEKGVDVLRKLNFKIQPGEMIALVGPTGAGKTTIVNLISRFYDVTGGTIFIDGYDISKVTLNSLRSQMGVMMQDTFIFSGTIMDNIRYGRLDATDEEVMQAARVVHADEFISKLEKGYQTMVDERGSSLSTGERQLLAFARVILADPKILILDEATSSIDTKTEKKIQSAIQKVLEGRTSFVIAHRLSTIRQADKIMYVDKQNIIESGTHDELVHKGGAYAELYKSQYSFIKEGRTA